MREVTRQHLIDACTEHIWDRGYATSSVALIAESAGAPKGSVFLLLPGEARDRPYCRRRVCRASNVSSSASAAVEFVDRSPNNRPFEAVFPSTHRSAAGSARRVTAIGWKTSQHLLQRLESGQRACPLVSFVPPRTSANCGPSA